MAEFCVICAAPRSGTTLLSDAVSRAWRTAVPSEIFHEDGNTVAITDPPSEPDGNFFAFRSRYLRTHESADRPDLTSRRRLFAAYLDYLRNVFRNDRILIDIKYNSWHHLDGFWRFPLDPPGLVGLLREQQIPVVHLVRRNLFALYCSLRSAEQSDRWHREAGQPAQDDCRLQIDVRDCNRWMGHMQRLQALFPEWLGTIRSRTLAYEELLSNGGLAPHVVDVFAGLLERPPSEPLTVGYQKLLPPLAQVVSNPEEVVNFFSGTAYEEFVSSSLS